MKRFLSHAALALGVIASSLAIAAPAQADSSGCNGNTALHIFGNRTWVEYFYASNNCGWNFRPYYGHFRIFGPGFSYDQPGDTHGPDPYRVDMYRHLPDGAKICAEGWMRQSDGSYKLNGRPCNYILDHP